jgi:hypothetical protein
VSRTARSAAAVLEHIGALPGDDADGPGAFLPSGSTVAAQIAGQARRRREVAATLAALAPPAAAEEEPHEEGCAGQDQGKATRIEPPDCVVDCGFPYARAVRKRIVCGNAPDPGSCCRRNVEVAWPGSGFFVPETVPERRHGYRRRESRGNSYLIMLCLAGPIAAYVISSLTKEPVMGIVAWVIPGLAAGPTGASRRRPAW